MKASANPGCPFSSGTCFSHWPAMVGETRNPSRAYRIAVSKSFSNGSLPNLRCSSSHADTQPGTVTVFQPRVGIAFWPPKNSGVQQAMPTRGWNTVTDDGVGIRADAVGHRLDQREGNG